MPNFLRHIRKYLLAEKKVSKYLVYALGEIILVVIGILIAFQVNDWSEKNKIKSTNIKNLTILLEEIKADSILCAERLPFTNSQLLFNEALKKRVYADQTTIDTLVKIARYEYDPTWVTKFYYNRNTYNSMQSSGSFELLDDGLKGLLISYYTLQERRKNSTEAVVNQYSDRLSEYLKHYNFEGLKDVEQAKVVSEIVWNKVIPEEFAPRFNTLLINKSFMFEGVSNELKENLADANAVIDYLNEYLDKY